MNTQQQQQLSGALTRILGLCFCAILVVVALTFGADAQDLETRFLRIGTGSPGGTYFPIGNAIAEAISAPIDTVDCSGNDDACVAGLMAVARASFGAVENLANVRNGLIESGFVQSDLAHWATHGEALYEEAGPTAEFRAIAGLYPELLHIVVPADSAITSPADLEGRRVSLGPDGSGTLIDAQLVLSTYGLEVGDVEKRNLTFEAAADALRKGEIDAFFAIGGVPLPAITDLSEVFPIRILSLDDWAIDALTEKHPFLSREAVDMSAYGLEDVDSVAVEAIWLTTDKVPDDIIYEVTRALWQSSTRQALAAAHPVADYSDGARPQCLSIPLHPGAERFYREAGALCHQAQLGQVTN